MKAESPKAIVQRLMKVMAKTAEQDRLRHNRYIGYCTYRFGDIEAQAKCLKGVVRVRWYSAKGDPSSKAEMERWLLHDAEDREVTDQSGEVMIQENRWKLSEYKNYTEHLESVLKE